MSRISSSSARALVNALADCEGGVDIAVLHTIERSVRRSRVVDTMAFTLTTEADGNGGDTVSRYALLNAVSECGVEDLRDAAAAVGVTLHERKYRCGCCGHRPRSPGQRRPDMPVAALSAAAVPALGAV